MLPALISGQLEIADAAVAASKADRALPIREARTHPALRIERRTVDGKVEARDRNMPGRRNLAARHLGDVFWHHADLVGCERQCLAVGCDQLARRVVAAIGLS